MNKIKPYYQTENGQLYHGDCLEVMQTLQDKSIDLVLTDPPYLQGKRNTNIKFKTRKDFNTEIANWDQKDLNIDVICEQSFKLLTDKGNIAIFTGIELFADYFKYFNMDLNSINNYELRVNMAIWHKTNPTPSVRKVSFLSSIEPILTVWKQPHTFNFTTQNDMHNHFESPICQGNERTDHPTQKPVKLIEKLITILSNKNDLVLDPFLGSGTTAVACENLDRKWIGIEQDKNYCDIAVKRIQEATSQMKMFSFGDL